MSPTTTPLAPEFVAWFRARGGRWREVGRAPTYREACELADEYLRTMPNPPMHSEQYIGSAGTKPPMMRRVSA